VKPRIWIFAWSLVAGCTQENPFATSGSSEGTQAATTSQSTTAPATETASPGDPSTTGDRTTGETTEPTLTTTTSETAESTTGADTGAPVCDPATRRCVPAVPAGWDGPVALVENAADEEVPSCGASFPLFAFEALTDLEVEAAECDCECGAPNNATCATPTVQRKNVVNCGAAPNASWLVNACSNLVTGATGQYWRATSQVNGGTCVATATNIVSPAGFETRITACASTGGDALGCEADESCIPSPDAPLDGRVCVWQAGDLQCPAGDWTARQLIHQNLDDDRGCSPCACGTATGACTGSVGVRNLQCGAQTPVTSASLSIGAACQQVNFSVFSAGTPSVTPSNPTCAAANSTPVGDADPVEPITLCCLD